MCDRRCLTKACHVPMAALAPSGAAAAAQGKTNRVLRAATGRMPPARAAPGMVAVASGPGRSRASVCMRARAARREARAAALIEAEVGRLRAGEQSGGGRRRRAAQVGHGAARGAAPPHLFPPEAPPREHYPAEAVQRHLRRPRDRGGGAARTYITKRTYTNAPLQRELAAKKRPPAPRGAARPGQITARVTPSSRGQHIPRKQAAPAARLAVTAREAPAGGERRKRTRRPRARS